MNYKLLSIIVAKDIKDDIALMVFCFKITFCLKWCPASHQRMVRVENMVERGVGHILSLP